MSGILEINYGTLETAADNQRTVKDTLGDIEQQRASANLPSGSLGKILPSEDIVTGFREATEATQEALSAAMEVCGSIADRVDMLNKLFRETDEQAAKTFKALGGGA